MEMQVVIFEFLIWLLRRYGMSMNIPMIVAEGFFLIFRILG